MSDFRIFDRLDPALVAEEIGDPRASKSPAVWPSEASAYRIDRSLWNTVGKCHRQAYYRMCGFPITNPADATSAWKWMLGRSVEEHLTDLCKLAKVYVANGVKHWIPDVMLSIELDVVMIDPITKRLWVGECKSFAGYYAQKEILTAAKPKLDNLLQASMYLLEMRDGKKLKQVIKESLAERARLDARQAELAAKGIKFEHRYRTEADLEMLEQASDGPIGTKLVYVDRGEGQRKEFCIEIMEDFDGSHYPVVDGTPWKVFTLESIYTRYKTLQQYWFRARAEAVRRLQQRGVNPPAYTQLILDPRDALQPREDRQLTKEQWAAENEYYERLEAEVRGLPNNFLPPAEYEWSYSPERVEQLWAAKEIGKTKYNDYKKDKIKRLGDWQCAWCSYNGLCLKERQPEMAYQVDDLIGILSNPLTEVEF